VRVDTAGPVVGFVDRVLSWSGDEAVARAIPCDNPARQYGFVNSVAFGVSKRA